MAPGHYLLFTRPRRSIYLITSPRALQLAPGLSWTPRLYITTIPGPRALFWPLGNKATAKQFICPRALYFQFHLPQGTPINSHGCLVLQGILVAPGQSKTAREPLSPRALYLPNHWPEGTQISARAVLGPRALYLCYSWSQGTPLAHGHSN